MDAQDLSEDYKKYLQSCNTELDMPTPGSIVKACQFTWTGFWNIKFFFWKNCSE